jgi:hypothetical protein
VIFAAVMSVDRPSREYELMASRWKQMRDCVAGSKAIKEAGTVYLPALAGHKPYIRGVTGVNPDRRDPYWDYVDRALYYNATAGTIRSHRLKVAACLAFRAPDRGARYRCAILPGTTPKPAARLSFRAENEAGTKRHKTRHNGQAKSRRPRHDGATIRGQ